MNIEHGKLYKTRDGRKAGSAWKGTDFHGPDSFMMRLESGELFSVFSDGREYKDSETDNDLVAEWTDKPKTWGELTADEKVTLVEARRDHKWIEYLNVKGDNSWDTALNPGWYDDTPYRIKPEPVVEEVEFWRSSGENSDFISEQKSPTDTHRISYTVTDGKPDCSSIKMEPIGG